jgi:hypothetical protein
MNDNDELQAALARVQHTMGTFSLGPMPKKSPEIEVNFVTEDGKKIAPPEGGAVVERAFARFVKDNLKERP